MAASTPKIIDIILGDGQISVRLSPVAVADSYTVQASTSSRFAEIEDEATAANADSLFVLSVPNGERYKIRAFSTNGATNSFAYKARGFYLPSGAINAAPVASSVAITGTPTQGQTLTRTYTYSDTETDPEGTSLTQWFRSDNTSALNRTAISGATGSTYVLQAGDVGKYIQARVTPKATSGTLTGTAVFSSYSAVIASSGGGSLTGYFLHTDTATPPTEAELLAGTEFVIPTDDGNFTTTIPNIPAKYIHMGEPSTQTVKTVMNDTTGDAAINGENAFGSITTQGAFRVYTSNYQTGFDNPITWKIS